MICCSWIDSLMVVRINQRYQELLAIQKLNLCSDKYKHTHLLYHLRWRRINAEVASRVDTLKR